jgi:hypothetical protein
VAKQGHQWAFLRPGQAIAQIIGRTDADIFNVQRVERLFVGLTLSTVQNDASNEVSLTVSLYAADSRLTWANGALISSSPIRDRTNDNRGDPNSYLDAYAVLKLDNGTAQAAGAHYWLVLENTLSGAGDLGATIVDQVDVFTTAPPPADRGLPNILIVFQDDMGYGDASFMNSESKISTPNLDQLAQQGMRFTPTRPRRSVGRVAWACSPALCRTSWASTAISFKVGKAGLARPHFPLARQLWRACVAEPVMTRQCSGNGGFRATGTIAEEMAWMSSCQQRTQIKSLISRNR